MASGGGYSCREATDTDGIPIPVFWTPCGIATPGHPAKKRVGRVDVAVRPPSRLCGRMGESMSHGSFRRRSSSSRARAMPLREAHAVAYHILHLIEQDRASAAQSAFYDALVDELERRWLEASSTSRCHCRMCVPATRMGWGGEDDSRL